MRSRGLALAATVAALLGVGAWFGLHRESHAPVAPVASDAGAPVTARTRITMRRAKPRGEVAGRVSVSGAQPLPPEVLVCVRAAGAEAMCVDAAPTGEYRVGGLPEGEYDAWASATGFAGPRWTSATGSDAILIGPGDRRTGIDLQLLAGAVELTGVVRDLRGTAIGGALVVVNSGDAAPPATAPGDTSRDRAGGRASFATRTNADGAFTAWAQPGPVASEATAPGFTAGSAYAFAPARDILIELVPASTVTGLVIEAGTKRPIAGASVEIGSSSAETDADGRFRIEGLSAGRYTATATALAATAKPRRACSLPSAARSTPS